jgi:hypothetical protein
MGVHLADSAGMVDVQWPRCLSLCAAPLGNSNILIINTRVLSYYTRVNFVQ